MLGSPLAHALSSNHFGQMQVYGLFSRGAELLLACQLTGIEINESNRVACQCAVKFRRLTVSTWEQLPSEDPFLVPGPAAALECYVTALGRVVIASAHPKETVLTVLFPIDDPGTEEFSQIVPKLQPVDLDELAVVALKATLPAMPGDAATEDDGIPF